MRSRGAARMRSRHAAGACLALMVVAVAAARGDFFAAPGTRVIAHTARMEGPAAFRVTLDLAPGAYDAAALDSLALGAPPPFENAGLIAIPVGFSATVTILASQRDDLGFDGPPPAGGPGFPERAVDVIPIGVVRHLNLGRLRVAPVVRDQHTGRWQALRRVEVRVGFTPTGALAPRGAHAPRGAWPEAEQVVPDPIDQHLASLVMNPATVPEATTRAARTAVAAGPGFPAPESPAPGIPATGIPAPEPSVLPPVKVLVRQDGLYRITRDDLLAAGADPAGIDPRTFVLTCRSVEVPLEVAGEADGAFDSGDVIRFQGQAVGGEETWDNVYRLTGGIRNGLRMATRPAQSIGGVPLAGAFRDVVRRETDVLYYGGIPGIGASPWLWESLATSAPGTPVWTDQTLTLAGVAAGSPATARLEVHVQSRRETPGVSPNHHVRAYVNGHLVADETWTGLQGVTLAADLPSSWLHDGANVVRIENPSDLGLSIATEYTDRIALTYPRTFVAQSDLLEFSGPGDAGMWRFVVTGFGGPDILLYDLGDPGRPVIIEQPALAFDGVSWQVIVDETIGAPPGRYLALRPAAAGAPQGLVLDQPSGLRARAVEGADLLIVAADPFAAAIEPLAALRRDQGLRVAVAPLTDLFDEFNGGIAETQGLRNFVQWAFENYAPPAPSSLLLVGDATYDPKDYKGEGDNHLSTRFFQAPGFGYAPSDTWFAAVTGDDPVPDLAVGRITARSAAEVTTQVDRIVAYENAPPVAALNSGLLYVADDDDVSFPLILDQLVATWHPPAMEARRVALGDYPQTTAGVTAARDAIRQAIDTGALATVYAGHGSRTAWAAEGLWSIGHVATLAESDRLTFVASLNCVNGYFANLDAEPWSLGEAWGLSPHRGAVAAWTPSALSTLADYEVLSSDLFRQLFALREPSLGRASWLALLEAHLAHGIDVANVQEMIFFGDPATRLALDRDRDGLLDRTEAAGGTIAGDADSDDDGVGDGTEEAWDADSDGDGAIDALDFDADNDALPDGLERGVTTPLAATDVSRGHFAADADPATTTNPLAADTDGGGAPDGAEDRDADGRLDADETDPNSPGDDPACAPTAPAEVTHLLVTVEGNDVVLSWDDPSGQDPCVLYRVYVAPGPPPAAGFAAFAYAGTVGTAGWRHLGAAAGAGDFTYLVTATSLAHGEGMLGHYGR